MSAEDARQARGISAADSPADVYMRLKVNGMPTFALLDTGCENNICGRRLITNVELAETSQRLFTANGTPVTLLGQTVIKINVNSTSMEVAVVVSETIDELILGIPFLVEHNFWNFSSSQILIDGKCMRLCNRPGRCSVRRIYDERDTVIPPASAMDVPVVITRSSLRQSGELWAVEPKCMGDGVVAARTLDAGTADKAFLRVMNVGRRKYTVRRDKIIGAAEEVSLCNKFDSGQACGPAEATGREAGGVEAGCALPAETGSFCGRPVND